ncbi:MAG: hypothetical protein KAG20_09905, partial [Cocleimonas sp.]|nr:hypothetical protein [Cocleimonas sp.]
MRFNLVLLLSLVLAFQFVAVQNAYADTDTTSAVLDVDGSGEAKALTDGLLLLRYLFDFRGDTLISNAVGANATRQTADAIESYLGSKIERLDIDGDGDTKALTDGLLILRYLFGFRSNTLIDKALGKNATRVTSDEIETYIKKLKPIKLFHFEKITLPKTTLLPTEPVYFDFTLSKDKDYNGFGQVILYVYVSENKT